MITIEDRREINNFFSGAYSWFYLLRSVTSEYMKGGSMWDVPRMEAAIQKHADLGFYTKMREVDKLFAEIEQLKTPLLRVLMLARVAEKEKALPEEISKNMVEAIHQIQNMIRIPYSQLMRTPHDKRDAESVLVEASNCKANLSKIIESSEEIIAQQKSLELSLGLRVRSQESIDREMRMKAHKAFVEFQDRTLFQEEMLGQFNNYIMPEEQKKQERSKRKMDKP